MSHVTPRRACHMLPPDARVTCYLGARVSHGTQGKVEQRRSIATSNFRPKSRSLYYDDDDDDDNADDAHADDDDDHLRVASYPQARVSHVTLGRACHMVPRAK